jgi:hypothetical protein
VLLWLEKDFFPDLTELAQLYVQGRSNENSTQWRYFSSSCKIFSERVHKIVVFLKNIPVLWIRISEFLSFLLLGWIYCSHFSNTFTLPCGEKDEGFGWADGQMFAWKIESILECSRKSRTEIVCLENRRFWKLNQFIHYLLENK